MLLVEREAQNRSKLQMFYEGLCKTLLESHLSDEPKGRSTNSPRARHAGHASSASVEPIHRSEPPPVSRPQPIGQCPRCGQKLRLPAKGRGTVVCPNCTSRLSADATTGTITLGLAKEASFEDGHASPLKAKSGDLAQQFTGRTAIRR